MQPEGPYRYTHLLGAAPVGKAWAAIDAHGRFVTIAVLDAAVAATPGWRDAFAGIANALTQGSEPMSYLDADFSAATPWVAYPSDAGPGAEKLLRALGTEYQPVPADIAAPVSAPPQPVPPQPVPPQPVPSASGQPVGTSPVSAPPDPVSGPPRPVSAQPAVSPAPWAMSQGPVPMRPAPVSGPPAEPVHPPYDPFSDSTRRIRPSERPPRRTGRWLALAALTLTVAVGSGVVVWIGGADDPVAPSAAPTLGGSGFPSASGAVNPGLKPWAEAAPYSPEERALAVAAPSLVFVEAVFTGVVREARSNVPLSAAPVTFKRRCTGFVANADGHVVTNGQCVRPEAGVARERALYTLGRILIEQRKLTPADLNQYVRSKLAATVFTGDQPGSEPSSQLFGQLNVARGDLTATPAVAGRVLRVLPPNRGNLALVTFDQANLPAVELYAEAANVPGDALLVVGYRTTDTDFRAATYTLAAKQVQVAAAAGQGDISVLRVNDDVGIYSHGGIAVDAAGRVVGVIDNDRAANGGANRALVPVTVATGLLSEAGVSGGLGDNDRLYRSALDAFFAGRNAEAISRFDAVAQASPANLLARAYRQNAVDRARLEEASTESSSMSTVLLAGLAGAVLVGLVVAVVLVVRRRRSGY